ncbi:MAG: protein kinase [Deltaproteobacteria bacterium]|jgi:serine/threonine protein kinase|nr:protein kinase [Deltaproteobacteria bacterium]MBP6831591.1 protein kinase [Deltaproteobacteria bacterium]
MGNGTVLLSPDSLFADVFRVVRPLGESTPHNALYLTRRLVTARECALRVLGADLVATPESRSRFDELSRVRARIHSDHVIDLLDAGVDKATGAPWFAMPFIEGKSLAVHARARLPESEVLEILAQLTHALGALHDAEYIHGPLDPAKILMVESEHYGSPFTVKVLDFWTSTWLRESAGSDDRPGVATLLWSAPEQVAAGADVGPPADVWSFGLLAFRLLTGKAYWKAGAHPKEAAAKDVLQEITAAPLEPAGERARSLGCTHPLPDGFDEWFARCVARPVDERFADIDEAITALAPLLGDGAAADDGPVDDDAPSGPSALRDRIQALPPWVRSPDFAIPAALTLTILLALGIRTVVRSSSSSATRPSAPGFVATAPTAPAAPAAPAAPVRVAVDERITAELVRRLGTAPRGSPAWIAASPDDAEAMARANQLRAIFTRAGWEVRPIQTFSGRLRPGYFVFAGDEEPPTHVTTIPQAFEAVGLTTVYSRGYRAYYQERLFADPNFAGIAFEPNQTFVVVVGRAP